MNNQIVPEQSDQDTKGLFRVGSLACFAIAAGYVTIIALYATVGPAPAGGPAKLDYLIGKQTTWWAIVGLSVLTNFLYVPVALSLYFALRKVNEVATLVGILFIGLFIALENAVNWTAYGALIVLSSNYAAATTEAQKAPVAAAATYGAAVLDSPLAALWAIGTLSLAFLILGLVMLKGVFSKATAYIGILTGILGLAAVAGVGVAVILNATAALVWIALVGYKLYRLAARTGL